MPFCFGFRRPKGGSTLWYLNARDGKAIPAPRFSPAAKTLVRRTRANRQKAGWVVLLKRSCQSQISISTGPSEPAVFVFQGLRVLRINVIRPHFGGRIFYRLFDAVRKLGASLYPPGLRGVVRQSLNHALRGDVRGGEK